MLILAAGESKRMGKVKQLLAWKNTTLLGHTIEQGLATSIDALYVVLGANAEIIEDEIKKYDCEILINADWKKGMGNSLAFAIKHIQKAHLNNDGILVALGDQPLLERANYQNLIDTFNNGNKGIVATKRGVKAGAPALFSPIYYSVLGDLKEDIGAREIIKENEADVAYVDVNEEGVDVNLREEYLELIVKY